MKKAISILTLALVILIGVSSASAKNTRKKSSSRGTSSVIGKFNRYGQIINLLSNGSVQSTDKWMVGKYQKCDGGTYYKVFLGTSARCGEGDFTILIIGNNVYEISAGSVEVITDFSFNTSTNVVTITEIDGGRPTSEELENLDLSSPHVSLSKFDRLGTITWIK